ncbi:hypothetical protein FPQ13_08275 [Allobacillus salarius]|uniref:Anti-sigma factor n=2 Tax=Bacillaceae TaxID=186817 RepID=A0A556PKN5_9BACI|nr:hypothetical protein FPQ13_08275 [Allobacillus salarius]
MDNRKEVSDEMACTHGYQEKIHQYIDQEMSYNEELSLKNHLMNCDFCLQHFRELKDVEKQLKNSPAVSQPSTFKQDIIDRLPIESKSTKFVKTIKEHPLITACAVFLVMLMTSAFIEFQSDQDVYVSSYEGIQVEGNRVIVPEGKVIHGDLTIENAIVEIKGHVNGNVTLVNSELAQANNNISGEIVQVNRFLKWAAIRFSRQVSDFFQQFSYQ